MRLDTFNNAGFERGASRLTEALWMTVGGILVSSWVPGSLWRVGLLRLFGSRIGKGVVLKPGVRVKFPWRLTIGDYSWVGESVWIDNLAQVSLGQHVCVSQGVYFCTGSHDWSRQSFDLSVKPIAVGSHAWVGAKSKVGPGVVIGEGAVLTLGSTATRSLDPWVVHCGNPAVVLKKRPRPC